MMRLVRGICLGAFALAVVQCFVVEEVRAQLVNRDWNTGNGNWNVAGNWSPITNAPDNGTPVGVTYNVQIGNLIPAKDAQVTFVPVSGTGDTIETLTISNGADLVTNGNQLNVNGLIQITTSGVTAASLRVDPHAVPTTPSLQTGDLDLTSGGGLQMNGGIATVFADMDVATTGIVSGFGTLNVGDFDLAAEQAYQNSGLLQVSGTNVNLGTLTIHATGVDTIDLDGDNEAGHIDVANAVANVTADTLTLIIDGPLADGLGAAAGGSLEIGQRDTVTFNQNFSFDAGFTVNMNGGTQLATLNGAGAVTGVSDTDFIITNKALIANNMTFTGTANTLTLNLNSSLELGGTVSIPDASMLTMTNTSELIITGNTTINEAAGDIDWDGTGTNKATTTIKGNGLLSLIVNHVSPAADIYGGTLNLDDNGVVSVNNVANVWTMAGTIHKRNAGTSSVLGDAVNITGAVTVDTGTLNLPVTTLSPTANITTYGTLSLGAGSVLAGPTSITGTGTLRMAGSSTVTQTTTVNTSSFDWDGGGGGTLQTINESVAFVVNSSTWDEDDAGDMDDPINIGGTGGQLIVNNVPSWTMMRTLTANTSGLGITTIGGNSRLVMSGSLAILNANGQVAVNAPITFGTSSSANIANLGWIRMNGGDGITVFNRIEGATINGVGNGKIKAINNKELRGFGTINSFIEFQNTSALRADDGTLTVGGTITECPNIGTADNDGILNVVNAWNSSVATNVVLFGGELQGGAITVGNANGIKGRGLVSARVVNNTRLEADSAGNTLAFQTAANDNDWDGGANTGVLAASNGGTLEVRDNATFTYGGTVTATGGSRVYSKGFGFNFFNTSAINLSESTLQADETTTINGTVNVAAGADSTINVQVNRFLDIKSTSTLNLNGNLRLVSNNGHIEAGAIFTGNGAVIVPAGSHLVPEANSNINTLLVNEGALRPGDFEGVGRVDMKDYQQTDTGQLYVELTGTLLNQYDRMIVNGFAQLDGYLNIDIDGGFVPALGNVFNIISATGGMAGTFDTVDVSGMPAGLTFHVNYTPTLVQLQVVNKPLFDADFDDDGDVDATDYQIWQHAFQLNQLGDATGDNISDARDYVIWRKEFGSHAGAGSGAGLAGVDGANVPEPGMPALAVAALLCAFGARKRGVG
jgi:hypothetical protein